MIEKYSGRVPIHEQVPKLDGPHESRFEAFEYFPKINSKYSTKAENQVPLFKNYSSRGNPKKE